MCKKIQAFARSLPMDTIGFRKRVALNNDQFGHISLNLLYLSRTLRTRQIVSMVVWQGKAKRRKGKSHIEKRESLKVRALPFFSFRFSYLCIFIALIPSYFPNTIFPPTRVI